MAKKKVINEEIDDLELNEELIEEKSIKEHFIIEENDFKMESSSPNDPRFFDLYFKHTVNKGKPSEREEFKLEGYGIALKSCLRRITAMRSKSADKKHFNSFKEFVEEYTRQANEVKRLFDILPDSNE